MSNKIKTQIILSFISLLCVVGSAFLIDDAKTYIGVVIFVWGSNIALKVEKI